MMLVSKLLAATMIAGARSLPESLGTVTGGERPIRARTGRVRRRRRPPRSRQDRAQVSLPGVDKA
jgi:hypothetical protein